jgi:hypothetical protein
MAAPGGRRSLLRRLPGAYGAALIGTLARNVISTRVCASNDATAGDACADGGYGEAAIPGSKARAPAVAIAVLVSVLCCAPAALADATPPPTTPPPTTPDAPPPDPYHPPAASPKPRTSPPKRSAPVVHSAPAPPTRSYSPPVTRAAPPVRSVPTRSARHVRVKKAARKPRKHVVHRHVTPKPVKVTFAPFANLAAAADINLPTVDGGRRDRYLRFAGLAFAVLAAAALSLHVTALRSAGVTR